MPRIGLGHRDRRYDSRGSQHRRRFRPPHKQFHRAQRGVGPVAYDLFPECEAHAGRQNQHLEAASFNMLDQPESVGVVGESALLYRRSNERFPALLADKLLDFSGAPAFQAKDLQAF